MPLNKNTRLGRLKEQHRTQILHCLKKERGVRASARWFSQIQYLTLNLGVSCLSMPLLFQGKKFFECCLNSANAERLRSDEIYNLSYQKQVARLHLRASGCRMERATSYELSWPTYDGRMFDFTILRQISNSRALVEVIDR
jgi:hypothetical protein